MKALFPSRLRIEIHSTGGLFDALSCVAQIGEPSVVSS